MYDAVSRLAEVYALGSGPWTITPVTRGALGQIWKLSGNGREWAVKEMLFGCDEQQVRQEAGLRDTSERLGIASPRLFANRDGAYVSKLPARFGGSSVKLYDWVDGKQADIRAAGSRPELLGWVGRTLALLHVAGAGASAIPDSWYEQCPRAEDWAKLGERLHNSGLPWSDTVARFDGPAAELARFVTPADPGNLVTSHLDVQPQNVLVGRDGPVLIDWDNAGSTSPDRELASVVYTWSGGNELDMDAARRLVRAYVNAGGPGTLRSLDSFSMLFTTSLNYIYVQAEAAVDPEKTAAQREFGDTQVRNSLRSLPDPAALSRLVEELSAQW